jgi:hypothetical protein
VTEKAHIINWVTSSAAAVTNKNNYTFSAGITQAGGGPAGCQVNKIK